MVVHDRLYRSRDDRIIFGVAGGMADWFDVDPALVRLVWAVLVLFGGAGLLLYIVAAIVIPEEPYETASTGPAGGPGGAAEPTGPMAPDAGTPIAGSAASSGTGASTDGAPTRPMSHIEARRARRAARRAERGDRSGGGVVLVGVVLVVVGGWFLLRDLLPNLDDRFLWPALLIVIGVLIVVNALRPRPHV